MSDENAGFSQTAHDQNSTSNQNDLKKLEEVVVISSDGERFNVPVKIMRQSHVFNTIYSKSCAEFEETREFNVSKVNGAVFQRVLDWCYHHDGEPEMRVKTDPHTRERQWFSFTPYQRRFFHHSMPVEELEDLLMTANFLDIPSLYLCGCQAMAEKLKNKSPEEIRSLLGLPDDLTDDEKQAIHRENVWSPY